MFQFFRNTVLLLLFTTVIIQCCGQNILLLEKSGGRKNFKYFTGNEIAIKTSSLFIKDIILFIDSNKVNLKNYGTLMIDSVEAVYRLRFGMSLLSKSCFTAGAGYFVIGTANQAITGNGPVFDKVIVIPSALLMGVAIIFHQVRYRSVKTVNSQWKLKGLVR